MKFKVGDRVRTLNLEDAPSYSNREGVVWAVDNNGEYKVSFNNNSDWTYFSSVELELIEEPKPIKSNRLKELTTALNILGSLGIELDVKIYAEINGKKISL
jgi:hypothetical protein